MENAGRIVVLQSGDALNFDDNDYAPPHNSSKIRFETDTTDALMQIEVLDNTTGVQFQIGPHAQVSVGGTDDATASTNARHVFFPGSKVRMASQLSFYWNGVETVKDLSSLLKSPFPASVDVQCLIWNEDPLTTCTWWSTGLDNLTIYAWNSTAASWLGAPQAPAGGSKTTIVYYRLL